MRMSPLEIGAAARVIKKLRGSPFGYEDNQINIICRALVR